MAPACDIRSWEDETIPTMTFRERCRVVVDMLTRHHGSGAARRSTTPTFTGTQTAGVRHGAFDGIDLG